MQTTSKLIIVSKLFTPFLLCLALLLVSGCGGGQHPSALAVKWDGGRGDIDGSGVHLTNLELLKDGTGTAFFISTAGHQLSSPLVNVKWKVANGRLYLDLPGGEAKTWDYKMSGGKLTLSHAKGSIEYERKR